LFSSALYGFYQIDLSQLSPQRYNRQDIQMASTSGDLEKSPRPIVVPPEPPSRMAPRSDEDPEAINPAFDSASNERCALLGDHCRVCRGEDGEVITVSPRSNWTNSVAEATRAMHELDTYFKETESMIVEQNSVYGTALVMPQLARSTGWTAKLTILAVRSYLFLVLNIFVQWMLLYSLIKEQNVMDKFSGQMYLCDFGAEKAACPDGPGCRGPGGTKIIPARTYSYKQWAVQKFVKNSLKSVFPDLTGDIDDKIDPGEYGVESQATRLVCTWLFILLLVEDAQQIINLLKLMWKVPNRRESWISYQNEKVVLQIKGIPLAWKIINLFMIILPKSMLCKFTADSGILFLMETPSMQDLIVNSTALTFILNIDELLFATITTAKTRYLLGILEEFTVTHHLDEKPAEKHWKKLLRHLAEGIPIRLMFVTVMWISCLYDYYYRHCDRDEEGTWYSKPMYLPLSSSYSHLSAFLPRLFPIPSEPDPFWVMPLDDS
jgi:hypothetical protein